MLQLMVVLTQRRRLPMVGRVGVVVVGVVVPLLRPMARRTAQALALLVPQSRQQTVLVVVMGR